MRQQVIVIAFSIAWVSGCEAQRQIAESGSTNDPVAVNDAPTLQDLDDPALVPPQVEAPNAQPTAQDEPPLTRVEEESETPPVVEEVPPVEEETPPIETPEEESPPLNDADRRLRIYFARMNVALANGSAFNAFVEKLAVFEE